MEKKENIILKQLHLDKNETETLEHLIIQMEKERGLDRSAAIASIKRELGGKWAASVVVWQCVIAWVAAFIVRLIGMI